MTDYPAPGTIGLTTVHGVAGLGIRIGQWLNGNGFKQWEHAFLYLGDGLIIEAEPTGAVIRPFHYDKQPVFWCSEIAAEFAGKLPAIAQNAVKYRGVKYSFLDYAALAARRLKLFFVPFLKSYVASTRHMICSQLDAQAYLDEGCDISRDKSWPGWMTPEAIYDLDVTLGIRHRARRRKQ